MTDKEQTALVALGVHLAAAERLMRELAPVVGRGFVLELTYARASFRQRFPDFWPTTGNDDEPDSGSDVAP